jgi:hypothetical protein
VIAKITNLATGERYEANIPGLEDSDVDNMSQEYTINEKIRSYIESLSVSAEVKVMLFKLQDFTVDLGGKVIKFGKKVIEIAIMLASKYKMATFGLILGALLTFLIGTIPIIGDALSGFLGTWIMLLGFLKGLWEDLKKDNPDLSNSIIEAGSIFSPLKA